MDTGRCPEVRRSVECQRVRVEYWLSSARGGLIAAAQTLAALAPIVADLDGGAYAGVHDEVRLALAHVEEALERIQAAKKNDCADRF